MIYNWLKYDAYRFGFNGQEKDDEVFGSTGTSYTAEFWQYDSRIGRRWNLDPKPNPAISQYATFNLNPIMFTDLLGDTLRFGKFIRDHKLFGALKKDLETSSGLNLTIGDDGTTTYSINKDAKKYSKKARKQLIKLIEDNGVVDTRTDGSGVEKGTNKIGLDMGRIASNIIGSVGINENTYGYAMSFFMKVFIQS